MDSAESHTQLVFDQRKAGVERNRRHPPSVAIELDGMTLRTSAGEEIATLTAAGWINPDGIRTDRVEIRLAPPVAIVSARDRAEHERHADEEWLVGALATLRDVATILPTFTVDDVWAKITMPPRDARAQMSRVMRAGEREALMRLTADTRPCSRNDGGRRVRVWHSLIYEALG